MPDFSENDYRALMGGLNMGDDLKDRIRLAADRRQPSAQAKPRSASRRTFVKFAAVAAGVAAVSFAAAGALPRFTPQPQSEGGAGGAATSENSFGLRAYADEDSVEAGRVKTLSLDFFVPGSVSSGKNIDGLCTSGAEYLFDFSCEGSNVSSICYTLGDGLFSVENAVKPGGVGVGFYEETQVFEGDVRLGATLNAYGSFSLDYDEQGVARGNRTEDDPLTRRTIMVKCVLSDETAALYDELCLDINARYREDYDSLDHEYRVRTFYENALALAATPLSLTATFVDGSTQTKVYRIAPADDFIEQGLALGREAFFEALYGLYTLEECEHPST